MPFMLTVVALLLGGAPEETPGYAPGGRRDPFVPRGALDDGVANRACPGHGLGAIRMAEARLSGVVRTRGEWLAVIVDPRGGSYLARNGARLCDGRVTGGTDGRPRLVADRDPKA